MKTGFHSGLGTGLLCFSFTLDRDGKDRKKLGVQLSESEGLFWSNSFFLEGVQSGFSLLYRIFSESNINNLIEE